MKYALLGGLALLLILSIPGCIQVNDRNSIREYISEQGETVIDIDYRMTTMGSPFYIQTKNNRIYKVTTNNGVYWFRKGNIFSDDIEKE